MISARQLAKSSLPRATRSLRTPCRQHIRLQSTSTSTSAPTSASKTASSSTSSSASSPASPFNSSAFAIGLAGGVAGAAICYGIYSFTPAGVTASKLNKAVKEAESSYQAATKKLQEKTPSAEDAVSSIKEFAYSYVVWIPGGRAYVDAAFADWEKVRKNHREEADQLVTDTYKKFQELSKSGLSLETANKAYEIIADLTKKVANLAGDAISDIIDNHPLVKEKLGGNVDQLKKLGDRLGPEAKKQVDETWGQVKDIFSEGFNADSMEKARKLIDDKVELVKKLGDEAWKKGLEELQPILEKNNKIKELVEKNADALKQGNINELFEKVKKAFKTGDLSELESFVKKTADEIKSQGWGDLTGGWVDVDKYLKMIPQGDSIFKKLKQVGEIAEENKDEGEQLLKETVEELKQVLDKKSEKAQEIVNKAHKQVN